jgi:zinc/manganese transport system substrate-binding protein
LLVAAFTLSLVLPTSASAAELKVVATLGDLAAAVREVGGKHVEVSTLARPQEDPHFVDAKPSYVRELSDADLLVYNGMSLEVGWLPPLIENARNGAIQSGGEGDFDASQHVERKGVPDQEIDRSMGDVHPEGNPHYTLAPRQMARVALALGDRLAELDSAHADAYDERARAFAKECLKASKRWEKKFESLPDERRKVVVYHEAWIYVRDWLGLEEVTTVEPKPGIEPNPEHVKEVVSAMNENDVPAILKMEYYPSSTVETIADKTDSTVVTSQGHTRGGQDYIDRVDELAGSIYEALKP